MATAKTAHQELPPNPPDEDTPEQLPADPAPATEQPSPALNGHYTLVGHAPGLVLTTHDGLVDTRSMSLELAHKLHKAGTFPFLQPVQK